MENFEEQEKQWLALPLGEVLAWLDDRTEKLWNKSVKTGGRERVQAAADYEKVESLHNSLARVVAWLASMQPPKATGGSPGVVGGVFLGKPQRARGRVCFSCGKQIRKTADLMIISPVVVPGLPVHEKCFMEIESEFGGKQ